MSNPFGEIGISKGALEASFVMSMQDRFKPWNEYVDHLRADLESRGWPSAVSDQVAGQILVMIYNLQLVDIAQTTAKIQQEMARKVESSENPAATLAEMLSKIFEKPDGKKGLYGAEDTP